jgi:hypothetical protein
MLDRVGFGQYGMSAERVLFAFEKGGVISEN